MSELMSNQMMLEMYIFETSQNIDLLEKFMLMLERPEGCSRETINEIFRVMHTIKGSSAMMSFNHIASLAHGMEDLFFFLRENESVEIHSSDLSDLVLEGVDFIKVELSKIKNGDAADGDSSALANRIKSFLETLKGRQQEPNHFKATLFFLEDCQMENIRAYTVIHRLQEFCNDIQYSPADILDNEESVNVIRENGFAIWVKTLKSYREMLDFFSSTVFLKTLELNQILKDEPPKLQDNPEKKEAVQDAPAMNVREASGQSIISVQVSKLDRLMDLMGEMVIAEAMVTENPDLKGLALDNFYKAARQLRKITSEIKDMVMSIRMVPVANTFHKMHRIVRDMSKKLNKEVALKIIGEETEIDKNMMEHISDPLIHLVRNAVDHGIETVEERHSKGKPRSGTITLEAKNAGSDVLIIIKDDGRGLNKEKILKKAKENGLVASGAELAEKEIFNLIFLPGFSTKEQVTEFSGRGVGMDVVSKNIQSVGGSVSIDSKEGEGTVMTLKMPLTLAIIDGMNIRVGEARYTVPISAITESFRPEKKDILKDPDGNEMILLRGQCHPIIRLHERFRIKTKVKDCSEGILLVVDHDGKTFCILADELLGQQQVVVKALPGYIQETKKVKGLAGCTLLGDGSISLILDIGGLVNN